MGGYRGDSGWQAAAKGAEKRKKAGREDLPAAQGVKERFCCCIDRLECFSGDNTTTHTLFFSDSTSQIEKKKVLWSRERKRVFGSGDADPRATLMTRPQGVNLFIKLSKEFK